MSARTLQICNFSLSSLFRTCNRGFAYPTGFHGGGPTRPLAHANARGLVSHRDYSFGRAVPISGPPTKPAACLKITLFSRFSDFFRKNLGIFELAPAICKFLTPFLTLFRYFPFWRGQGAREADSGPQKVRKVGHALPTGFSGFPATFLTAFGHFWPDLASRDPYKPVLDLQKVTKSGVFRTPLKVRVLDRWQAQTWGWQDRQFMKNSEKVVFFGVRSQTGIPSPAELFQ